MVEETSETLERREQEKIRGENSTHSRGSTILSVLVGKGGGQALGTHKSALLRVNTRQSPSSQGELPVCDTTNQDKPLSHFLPLSSTFKVRNEIEKRRNKQKA